MRQVLLGAVPLLLAAGLLASAEEKKADAQGQTLFNGKDLTGWKLIDPKAADRSKWSVAGGVKLKAAMPAQFEPEPGTGVLLNGGDGHGLNLVSDQMHGDCELHVEFNVSKGSNSGVYFMGRYEVQIFDSYGKKDSDLTYQAGGGIYQHAAPRTNACKAPGEWQTYDITFQAPRFDAAGNKTANGKFLTVVYNGKVIHENVEVTKTTAAGLSGPEKPEGPLMLQGDHGPVAFRNIRLKPLAPK
jgi:hypothetical protein